MNVDRLKEISTTLIAATKELADAMDSEKASYDASSGVSVQFAAKHSSHFKLALENSFTGLSESLVWVSVMEAGLEDTEKKLREANG